MKRQVATMKGRKNQMKRMKKKQKQDGKENTGKK